jgi:hypothetical protein
MSGKLSAFAVPMSLLAIALAAKPAVAATPYRSTFGVSVTVEYGCSVSAATSYQNYAAAMANAASSVSVNCNNLTSYHVGISAAADAVHTGKITSTLHPLTAAAGSSNISAPILTYGQPAGMPSDASSDNLSIAITY